MVSSSPSFAVDDAPLTAQTHLPTPIIILLSPDWGERLAELLQSDAALRLRRRSSPTPTNSTLAQGKSLNIWFSFKHGVVFRELCPRTLELDRKHVLASKSGRGKCSLFFFFLKKHQENSFSLKGCIKNKKKKAFMLFLVEVLGLGNVQ